MKKKILILGSEGQIGNHLKEYLIKKNFIVSKFDIVRSEKEDLRLNYNKQLVLKVKKADFIFFLAFDVGGTKYLNKYQNTYEFISNNIKIMENTFGIIKMFKKQFVFASSQMSNMNHSSYGLLKNLGEKYTHTLGGIVVKLWNVYGIEKDLKKSKKTLDIASGKNTRIIDIAKIIQNLLKKENIIIKIKRSKNKDLVQLNKKNKPNPFFRRYWKPNFSLENGIEKIINYYKK